MKTFKMVSFAIIPGNLSIIWWIYTVNLSDSHICFSRYELYPGYDSCFSQILTAGDSTMKKRYGGMAGVKPIYQVVGGGSPSPPPLGETLVGFILSLTTEFVFKWHEAVNKVHVSWEKWYVSHHCLFSQLWKKSTFWIASSVPMLSFKYFSSEYCPKKLQTWTEKLDVVISQINSTISSVDLVVSIFW